MFYQFILLRNGLHSVQIKENRVSIQLRFGCNQSCATTDSNKSSLTSAGTKPRILRGASAASPRQSWHWVALGGIGILET
jgi:hypothetical protein